MSRTYTFQYRCSGTNVFNVHPATKHHCCTKQDGGWLMVQLSLDIISFVKVLQSRSGKDYSVAWKPESCSTLTLLYSYCS